MMQRSFPGMMAAALIGSSLGLLIAGIFVAPRLQAQEAPKPPAYDFTQPIIDDQGRVAHERAAKGDPLSYDETSPVWTIGHVAAAALQQQQNRGADPADYLKALSRVSLALRVRDCRACDLTTDETKEIEIAVNAAFPAMFVYRVVEVVASQDLPKRQ